MHVKQLIIVAGPSAVGKTTLVKRIQEGRATSLPQQVKIDNRSLHQRKYCGNVLNEGKFPGFCR